MPPLVRKFLEEILTKALAGLFAVMVAHGWIQSNNVELYTLGAVGFILTLLWSLYLRYKDRLSFLSAKSLPAGTSGAQIKEAATLPEVKAQAFKANTDGLTIDPTTVQPEKKE